MKRILTALAMTLVASTAHAQVEWRWQNVVAFGNGFSGRVEFRNTNKYGDPTIVALKEFGVSAKQRLIDHCVPPVQWCSVTGVSTTTVGNVQTAPFLAGTTVWEGGTFFPITSSVDYQLNVPWVKDFSGIEKISVMGCQVPDINAFYTSFLGRTCVADGYDGWASFQVYVSTADQSLGSGYFTTDDVAVGFNTEILKGPNVMQAVQVVPEPSTYALLTFGLGALLLVHRKRRAV